MFVFKWAPDLAADPLRCERECDLPLQFVGQAALKQARAEAGVSGRCHRRAASLDPTQVQLTGHGAPANSHPPSHSRQGAIIGAFEWDLDMNRATLD